MGLTTSYLPLKMHKYTLKYRCTNAFMDGTHLLPNMAKSSVDTQLGRRNLTPIQRITIAEKYRPVFLRQAKENLISGLKQNSTVLPKSDTTEKIHTRDELAKIAGVGHDTYGKGKKIIDLEKDESVVLNVLSIK